MAKLNNPVEITYMIKTVFGWKKRQFTNTTQTPTFDSLKYACVDNEEFKLKHSRPRLQDIAILKIFKIKSPKIS